MKDQEAPSHFRVRLLDYIESYTFHSTHEWYSIFVTIRITNSQNNLVEWKVAAIDPQYTWIPRSKPG